MNAYKQFVWGNGCLKECCSANAATIPWPNTNGWKTGAHAMVTQRHATHPKPTDSRLMIQIGGLLSKHGHIAMECYLCETSQQESKPMDNLPTLYKMNLFIYSVEIHSCNAMKRHGRHMGIMRIISDNNAQSILPWSAWCKKFQLKNGENHQEVTVHPWN